ncbi:hypothetical protein ACUIAJ_03895 [Dermabacteraceae bacterium CCM 9519]
MSGKTSRLYRHLADHAKPLFRVRLGEREMTDHEITSIKINRGATSGTDEGLPIATAEVTAPELIPVRTGQEMTIKLDPAAAKSLAAALDGAPYLRYIDRYRGRIGVQNVDDLGKRQHTSIAASSWAAQLLHSKRRVHLRAESPMSRGVADLVRDPVLAGAPISFTPPEAEIWLAQDMEGSYRDLFNKLVTDIGLRMYETRAGRIIGQNLAQRRELAHARIETEQAITRSQALAPAKWAQPSEIVSTNYVVEFLNARRRPYRRTADLGSPATSPEQVLDWKHLVFSEFEQQWRHIEGLEAREYDGEYRIDSLTIDLLHLISSPRAFHRKQAAQLLQLEAGDSVNLSGDWHPDLEGVHFATGITEEITGKGWFITLSLTPYRHIFGHASPPVPPKVWDQFGNQWDQAKRTWEGR